MASTLEKAVAGAVAAVAKDANNSLTAQEAPKVAAAITEKLPDPIGLESLWPQLARYAIAALGSVIVGRGWVDANEWQILGGAVIAVVPVVWRVVTTLLARRAA